MNIVLCKIVASISKNVPNITSSLTECLHELDIDSPDFQLQICRVSGLSYDLIKEMGRSKPREFVPKLVANCRRNMGIDFAPESLIGVRKGWDHLSITVPIGIKDESERYSKALTPTATNCGLNVVFAIGLQLQLGRIQRDVVSLQYSKSLYPPTQTFLQILRGPFGLVPQDCRDKGGMIMESALEMFNPAKFPRGKFVAVQGVLDTLCYRVPQVTWNQIKTYTCCDGEAVVHTARKEKSYSGVYIWLRQGENIGECVQRQFKDDTYEKVDSVCSRGKQCTQAALHRSRVLVDGSNPARLIVHFDSDSDITWYTDTTRKLGVFNDIKLETWCLNGTFTNEYEVVGAVFVVDDNHFVMRWKRRDTNNTLVLLHFDGGVYSQVDKWWDGYRRPGISDKLPLRERVLQGQRRKNKQERVLTLIYQILI